MGITTKCVCVCVARLHVDQKCKEMDAPFVLYIFQIGSFLSKKSRPVVCVSAFGLVVMGHIKLWHIHFSRPGKRKKTSFDTAAALLFLSRRARRRAHACAVGLVTRELRWIAMTR